jgi:hypothetical protein
MFVLDYILLPLALVGLAFWIKRTRRLNEIDRSRLALLILGVAIIGGLYFTKIP